MERNPTWLCVVALALKDEAGRWLMHRRPPGKQHGGLWEFPGGKVEEGELPASALVREIAEELEIAIDAIDLQPAGFAQTNGKATDPPIVILLYTARCWKGRPRAVEGGALAWLPPAEILELDVPPLDHELRQQLFATRPR